MHLFSVTIYSVIVLFLLCDYSCMEAVAWSCIIVIWWSGSGGIQAWSQRPTDFLQCFDSVGLVIGPVKIVPDMTCNVSSGTLSLYAAAAATTCRW